MIACKTAHLLRVFSKSHISIAQEQAIGLLSSLPGHCAARAARAPCIHACQIVVSETLASNASTMAVPDPVTGLEDLVSAFPPESRWERKSCV